MQLACVWWHYRTLSVMGIKGKNWAGNFPLVPLPFPEQVQGVYYQLKASSLNHVGAGSSGTVT